MFIIRFISALLFACVLAALLVVGLWTLALRQAESQLTDSLAAVFGPQVTYDNVTHMYDPLQIHLVLSNLTIQHQTEAGAMSIVLPQVEVRQDFFGSQRVELDLPKASRITYIPSDGEAKLFELLLEAGDILLLKRAARTEFQFSATITKLVSVGGDGQLLNTGDVFVMVQPQSGDATLEFAAKNITIAPWQEPLSRLYGKFSGPSLVELLIAAGQGLLTEETYNGAQAGLVKGLGKLPPSQRDFEVINLHYGLTPQDWVAFAGELELDGRLRPAGEWMISTNNADWLVAQVSRTPGMNGQAFKERYFQRELSRQGTVKTFDVRVRLGEVQLDGRKIGTLKPWE